MAWFNFLRRREDRQIAQVRAEIARGIDTIREEVQAVDIRLKSGTQDPPRQQVQTAVRSLRRQAPATNKWKTARGLLDSGEYEGPAHNLMEIAKAIDVESHFARAVDRQLELTMKQGWRLKGRDPERVRYVTRRIHEICMISETTFGQLLEDVVRDLFTYANHQWVLKRDVLRSSGGPIRMHKRRVDPVAGIYPADPVSMSIKQNKSGNIERWKLSILHSKVLSFDEPVDRTYAARDVIHFHVNRKTGFLFGTPYVVPVLDDMRLLRRLEELTDIIAHKHAFPLMVISVGTDQKPADEMMVGGVIVPEVEIARQQIESADFEAGVVLPHRYEVQMIGAENKALDLKPYLEYMEKRVLGGLRLSEIDLGRGDSSNRNTAQTITQTLEDACSRVQRVVEEMVTWKLFFILLMEGGYDIDLGVPEESMVFLDFPPINREEQRAQENHSLSMYQGQVCTEDECRVDMGRKPLSEAERAGLHLAKVDQPMSEMQTEAKQTVERTKASVRNKTRPTNQHGRKATKPRISKDRVEMFSAAYLEQVGRRYRTACDNFLAGFDLPPGKDPNIGDHWQKDHRPRGIVAQNTRLGYQSSRLVHYAKDAEIHMVLDARTYLTPVINRGFEDAVGCEQVERNFVPKESMDEFFRLVRDDLRDALRSTGSIFRMWVEARSRPDTLRVRSGLETHGGSIASAARRQARMAYLHGYLKGAAMVGSDVAAAPSVGACPSCAPRVLPSSGRVQDMVCFKTGCRLEYSLARPVPTHASVP